MGKETVLDKGAPISTVDEFDTVWWGLLERKWKEKKRKENSFNQAGRSQIGRPLAQSSAGCNVRTSIYRYRSAISQLWVASSRRPSKYSGVGNMSGPRKCRGNILRRVFCGRARSTVCAQKKIKNFKHNRNNRVLTVSLSDSHRKWL